MSTRTSSPRHAESACPVCESPTSSDTQHLSAHNGVSYRLHHCPTCLLEHWSPREVDLSIYQDDGFEAYRDYHAGERRFPRWAHPLFARLPPGLSTALDVGCGDGSVLQRLQGTGITVRGIDLDEKSVRVANTRCGERACSVATLNEFSRDCQSRGHTFDLVTFFEVLEHQTDPRQFLTEVATVVRPGGWIAGSVPNRNRFLVSIDHKFGDGDFPPHHFLWFSRRALREACARCGYVDIEVSVVESATCFELNRKLKDVLRRRMAAEKRPLASLALGLIFVLAPAAAIFLRVGRMFRPSHLFFRCRRPGQGPGVFRA